MIKISTYQDAVGVYGLGLSGLACVRALLAGGADVLAWDDDKQCRDEAQSFGATLYDFGAHDFGAHEGARGFSSMATPLQALIVSPAVPLTHPAPHPIVEAAQTAGVPVMGDMALFAQAHAEFAEPANPAPIIAITGTNGKSTTTALTAHLLKACGYDVQMGGNIGQPVLALDPPAQAASATQGKTIYVLELSSYQIDLSPHFTPHIAVLLNLTPDHIERHGDFANYIAAKWQMFANLTADGLAIIGMDGAEEAALAAQYAQKGKAHLQCISGAHQSAKDKPIKNKQRADIYAEDTILYDEQGALIDLAHVPTLQGAHNLQNAAAAFAAAFAAAKQASNIQTHEIEVSDALRAKLAAAFADFPGLAHRLQPVMHHQNIHFVNDSKATNAEAAGKALAAFENIYWIAGGQGKHGKQGKQGGIASLTEHFCNIRHAYLIGAAAAEFAIILGEHVPHKIVGTLDKAVMAATQDAVQAGEGVILFSPACASFDQFENFAVRGEAFCNLVENCVASLNNHDGGRT